jgi:NAD(P)-dependent dehydrogenase (short-subunit alcohol dehydrogenase family)
LTALTGEEEIGAQRAYAQSKLALTMWSFYLAQQWPFATVVAVNPGSLLNTKMVKEAFGQHWAPVDKGAQILNELALVDHFANATGKYFDNDIGDFNMAHTDAYASQKVTELLRVTQSIIASYESLS